MTFKRMNLSENYELLDPTTSQTLEPQMPLRLKSRPKGSNNKLKEDFKLTERGTSLFECQWMNNSCARENLQENLVQIVIDF